MKNMMDVSIGGDFVRRFLFYESHNLIFVWEKRWSAPGMNENNSIIFGEVTLSN